MTRRRLYGTLVALVFLENMARIVFAPLLEPLMATFHVGPGTAGLIATLVWFGGALPRIPIGYLLTRVPRHHVILGSGTMLGLAALGAGLAPTITLLAIAAFCMGLATGAYFIAANPLVSELYPDRVGRALGTHHTSGQLAAVVAAPFVGLILLVDDYRLVFLIISAATFLVTLTLYWVARTTSLPQAGAKDRDYFGAVRAQWRLIVTGIAIIGTAGFVWNGTFNFYVSYLIAEKGISAANARDLLTVVFAAGVPAFWFGGRLADRFARIPLMLGLLTGFIISLLGLTITTGYLQLIAVSLIIGYIIHSLFPVLDTYMLDSLPDENRASAYSVYSGTMMIIQSTGSSVVGQLTEFGFTYTYIFRVFAIGLIVSLGILGVMYVAGRLPAGE